MLAAHRNGGRTNFGTFARAWDAFTGAKRRNPARLPPRGAHLEGYLEIALTREGAALLADGALSAPSPRRSAR